MNYEVKKRILDVFAAVLLGIIFLPVFLIVPVIIKLTSKGPVFFKQKRVGKGGREFFIYKFRSMIDGADEIFTKSESLLKEKEREFLKKFKDADWKVDMKNDPRITKFGAFMRTFTIDEFPQFWNIIKGEMSIVGPRAYRAQEIKEQVKKYVTAAPLMKDILKVKPGITGPWQTSGRNVVPFLKRAKMDAKYARLRSIGEDIKILLKTPKAMISRW